MNSKQFLFSGCPLPCIRPRNGRLRCLVFNKAMPTNRQLSRSQRQPGWKEHLGRPSDVKWWLFRPVGYDCGRGLAGALGCQRRGGSRPKIHHRSTNRIIFLWCRYVKRRCEWRMQMSRGWDYSSINRCAGVVHETYIVYLFVNTCVRNLKTQVLLATWCYVSDYPIRWSYFQSGMSFCSNLVGINYFVKRTVTLSLLTMCV